MAKSKVVDYEQAMLDFDRHRGKKPEDINIPLKSMAVSDGGVDYMAASRAFQEYMDKDESDAIRLNK